MSGDPFEELESQLRRAVRARTAARPAWHQRLRGRLGLPTIVVIGAVAVGGGGAVAATQLLPQGPPLEEGEPAPRANVGAGVVTGDPSILALRVADPDGGPPWALRVFASSRGGSCVQVGRMQGGHIGRVVTGADGVERFRPQPAVPGITSLCGGVRRDGFPVLRGLRRLEVRGGSADPRRCDGRPCPIDRATIIRFGLLGPQAREARFVDAAGVRATQRLDARQGGAYLFVERTDPAPFQAAEAAQRRHAEAIRGLTARGLTFGQALARSARSARRPRTVAVGLTHPADRVDARFADGTVLRVAGAGRTSQPLPGVTRRVRSAPGVRAALHARVGGTGASRRFTLSFRAPVAVTRADRHFTLTAVGHDGRRCTKPLPGGGEATTRNIARGDLVTLRDVGARQTTGTGRRTWCPGTTTLRVGYQTPGGPFAGRLVAAFRFSVAR